MLMLSTIFLVVIVYIFCVYIKTKIGKIRFDNMFFKQYKKNIKMYLKYVPFKKKNMFNPDSIVATII